MATWAVQDAKAKFSDVLSAATIEGPQVITRRGIETAVIVELEEWKRLSGPTAIQYPRKRLSSEELLQVLRSGPDFEIPDRHAERLAQKRVQKRRLATA